MSAIPSTPARYSPRRTCLVTYQECTMADRPFRPKSGHAPAAIWPNDHTGRPARRSLIGYHH